MYGMALRSTCPQCSTRSSVVLVHKYIDQTPEIVNTQAPPMMKNRRWRRKKKTYKQATDTNFRLNESYFLALLFVFVCFFFSLLSWLCFCCTRSLFHSAATNWIKWLFYELLLLTLLILILHSVPETCVCVRV